MSIATSSHAYGISIIAILIGLTVGISYYQIYYLPELLEKPEIAENILEPQKVTIINMIMGSANQEQQDNFVPKLVNIQLELDNKIVWENTDETPHTVTPDEPYTDAYSGKFGSTGVIKSGEKYEFLFTDEAEISYHCEPHPWMTGTLIVTHLRF